MQDKTNSPQQKSCDETLQPNVSWEMQHEKNRFSPVEEKDRSVENRGLHFHFWEWFAVVWKKKKKVMNQPLAEENGKLYYFQL